MDPYRHNQYGFRPQAPPPQAYGQRMPPPPSFGGSPQPTPTASTTVEPPSPEDKLNTLFVGAIATGISDAWIETLLKTCGNLKHWKRTKDASGNPKGFGFATYADPDSVLCALRVLGGETTDGVLLTSSDGTVQKKLIVKADDNVRNHLQGYQQQQHQQQQQDTEASDKEKYAQVQNHLQAMTGGQQPAAEDALSRDLAMFKEKAAQQDRDDRSNNSNNHRREERSSRRGDAFIKGPTEYHSHASQQDMTTDEEIERRRREKHERDVENAYHQRVKRFESREFQKMRDYKKDTKRELELEEREVHDKAYWMERLANWDDDLEMAKGEEPYYVDRSRWRRMRETQRRREEERDEEDRRRELQEIEDERIRLEEEELRKKDSRFLNRENDDTKIAIKPTKLNFNLSIKRNTLGSAEDEEEEEAKKKRRVLVPLDYGDIKPEEEEQEDLTEEERARRVKNLIDSIPSSQDELWKYSVKWEVLTEDLIETKLYPFVSKKIVDLLGMEEDDLVKFVLQFIRDKKGPDELVTELEGALDEDALVFVMKFWRALIFETERKYQRL